ITKANAEKYNYCVSNYLFFDFYAISPMATRLIRKALNLTVNMIKKKTNYIVDNNGHRVDLFHGSSWWALNIDVIRYIQNYTAQHREISNYFRYSLASDEKFFHTIFFNSVFAKTNLSGGEESFVPYTTAFANIHIIDPSLQKWFDLKDFDKIKDSD